MLHIDFSFSYDIGFLFCLSLAEEEELVIGATAVKYCTYAVVAAFADAHTVDQQLDRVNVVGEVVDDVGGGICQVTTTLYNAAIKANMEITQRRNHMFIPSYIGGGKDATVAWGSTDFKFINSRDYPIKIEADVSDGTCRVRIYGLRKSDDYDNIYLTTKTIKKTSNSIVIDSYRVYERDGEVVYSKKMYRDTYKVH